VTAGREPARLSVVCDSNAWGGAEVWATHLLRRAAARGWTASLVCTAEVADGFPPVPGGRVVVPLARHADEAPEVHAALTAQRPDVVVANLVDPGSNAAAVAAAQRVAPTVGVLHLEGDAGSGPQRQRLVELYAAMAAVVTPAAAFRRQLEVDLQVPPERVHVVPNGVDIPAEPAGPVGSVVPRIGAFGRLTEQKGFDVLLEAVRLLVAEGVAFDVVLGGAGRDGERLRAAAAGLPVTFPGFVTDARRFLAGIDVFCLSSRREALPLVLLEAMSEGLPCVATDVGDVRPAVAEDALVVPPEDPRSLAGALRRLVEDPALRRDLGTRARRRAERSFSADLTADRVVAVLDRVRHGSDKAPADP
jgi:glycosyltransferase involved in cell wall biosynthesis